MDSISQAALGAAVGVAVMGRTRPVWQAALTGAVVGTLPDLDVFVDQGDPIRNMVLHRAETHALFWQALASPVLGLLLAVITNSQPLFRRWWLMVVLTLFTHSALDAMTVYGTQIALPFSSYPVGLGSLFIIDPLYTLPLLIQQLNTTTYYRDLGALYSGVAVSIVPIMIAFALFELLPRFRGLEFDRRYLPLGSLAELDRLDDDGMTKEVEGARALLLAS